MTTAQSAWAGFTARSLARGLGQIFFQPRAWTGVAILAAFVVADWRMALLVLVGTAASTAAGCLLRPQRDTVEAGLLGFCGALVGAAAFTALGSQWLAWLVAAAGGLLCAPVTWALAWLFDTAPLRRFALPTTTAPFCLVAGLAYALTTDRHVAAASPPSDAGMVLDLARSLLTNIAEVVLVGGGWSGLLILIGLFLASWRVGVAALMGSAIGSVTALVLGTEPSRIGEGLAGYSGVLTAIALAVVFLRESAASWWYAALGAVLTAGVTLLMNDLTGGPVYTWPYILTTWVMLLIAAPIRGLDRS